MNPGGRFGYRKEDRRQGARERAEVRSTRTPQQQIDELDRRLGEGQGAVKEREKLKVLIENAKKPKKLKDESSTEHGLKAKERRSKSKKK